MATFADHLNLHREDAFSKMLSSWGRRAELSLTNFTVRENLYPRREYPSVSLAAEMNLDVYVGAPYGPRIESGTKIDLLWLETHRENPSKLFLAWRWARVTTPKGYDQYVVRQVNTAHYSLREEDPEGLLCEIFHTIVGTSADRIPDRIHRIVGQQALREAYERLEESAGFQLG
jgi:hypothetical protein